MKDFAGKVAFVTGGASGIGYGIAQALVAEGVKVMLADIEEAALTEAVKTLRGQGADVEGVLCDVGDADAVKAAADKTIETFGKVHIIVNNAGVAGAGITGEIDLRDWKWIVDVNLMGVVHGTEIFVPLIKSHGEGGHIINTASMAGHVALAGMGPYHATKFAVVGYTESVNDELKDTGIGASVLCPGWVNTSIHKSRRNHPDGAVEGAEDGDLMEGISELLENGMSTEVVGRWVVENIRNDALYIFTHPYMRPGIEMRHAKLNAAYDACEASDLIRSDAASSGPSVSDDNPLKDMLQKA